MDQNKYIEVRIFEPLTETSTSDTVREYSVKTLSTIHECDSAKISHNIQKDIPRSTNLKSKIESFLSSKQRYGHSDRPLDIDLLLRYYACNSNMEKSINKVLEKRNNQVCKDIDQGPLIELGAAYKICEFLRELSFISSFSAFRFHDVLVKLESFIRRCSNETLEQILTNDSSMKMCKHCGVISCSRPSNISVEPRRSSHKTSYLLSTQMFSDIPSSGDEKSEKYTRIKRTSNKNDQMTKCTEKCYDVKKNKNYFSYKRHRDNEKVCAPKETSLTVKRENNGHMNAPKQVETMVAERENDDSMINEKIVETDRIQLQNQIKNSQIMEDRLFLKKNADGNSKSGHMREQIKTVTNFENKNTAKSSTFSNFTNNLTFDRQFHHVDHKREFVGNLPNNNQNEWRPLSNAQLNINKSSETVVRDILYEQPMLDEFIRHNCIAISRQNIESKQDQATDVVNDTISSINVMPHLARDQLESIDIEKKESISQLNEKTCVHSRHPNDRRSFVLHSNRNYDPYPNSEFLIREKLMPTDKIINNRDKNSTNLLKKSQNYLEHCKYNASINNVKQFNSFSCLMEDDSLENCIKASSRLERYNESNTTIFSSSSAENMIHEWVKTPRSNKEGSVRDVRYKNSEASKPSIIGLNVEPQTFWANEKCDYSIDTSIDRHRYLQTYNAKKQWSLPGNRTKLFYSSDQTAPSTVNSSFKHWNSQESVQAKLNGSDLKKTEFHRSKKCSWNNLFQYFKSIKSIKSTGFKEIDSRMKLSVPSSNSVFKNISRRIVYNESSFKNMMDKNETYNKIDDMLLLYRKVLESTEEMDWQSFQRFVEKLHPNQKSLWCQICKSINKKLKKIANEDEASTEICIEITSAPSNGAKHERKTYSDEIVFEMDVTLGDVEKCLDRQLPSSEKEQLDTLKRASEVIKVQNDDVCDIEVPSNQAE